MFRENDCQTDPYTPDYFVEEGMQPEVLAIAELKWGEGLPAGLGEVDMIDRVQRRKMVESDLPQGNNNESMQKRLLALETLERLEWDEREDHIKGLQDSRLKQMERALQKREENREDASKQRVEKLKQSKLQQVDQKLQILQEKRLNTTRKLTAKHTNPCGDQVRRDIIQSHVLYGSRSKPVKGNSLVERMNTNNYDVRPTLLSFPEGVQELERTAAQKLQTVKPARLQPPVNEPIDQLTTNYQKRKAIETAKHLEHANSIIVASHEAKQKTASIQDLYRATPRLQRPDTPTLHLQGDDEEEKEEAMLLLQRLLRGRAVQNDFYEGKERCHGLIEELQSASNAKDANKVWEPDQWREAFAERQEQVVQSVVDGVEGDVIFGTLDYLFKELRRQQEASKVDKLRLLAEETRKERELVEREKREEERILRAQEEAQYAALTKSCDLTVHSYLSYLFSSTIQATAAKQALEEQWSMRGDQHAARVSRNEVERQELVCALLDEFIVPHVVKAQRHEAFDKEQALSTVSIEMSTLLSCSTITC